MSPKLAANGLQLQEVGDFEALNCLPPQNLIRSTKLHLTTEPPISCRRCYKLVFFLSWSVCPFFTVSWCVGLAALLDFFCVGLCGCKKYKCATKCVGLFISFLQLCQALQVLILHRPILHY